MEKSTSLSSLPIGSGLWLKTTPRKRTDSRCFLVLRVVVDSPVYADRKRDGCALCFNAKADERRRWFRDYPEAFNILLHLQDVVSAEIPDRYPLRDHKWFIEPNYQLSMFDEIKYVIN